MFAFLLEVKYVLALLPMEPRTDTKPMDVKEYLREARHAFWRADALCCRAERYRELATRATGCMDALRLGGTPMRSKVETYVLELMTAHQELKEQIHELLAITREAEKVIARLKDERYRSVLQLRYLCGYDWQDIADRLHFSLRWVHKLHGEALKELAEMYPNGCPVTPVQGQRSKDEHF